MMPHSTDCCDCCALAPDGKNAAVATTAAEAATVATADAIGARLKTFMGCFRGGCLLRLTGNLPFRRNTEVGLATHCLGVFCFDNELLVCSVLSPSPSTALKSLRPASNRACITASCPRSTTRGSSVMKVGLGARTMAQTCFCCCCFFGQGNTHAVMYSARTLPGGPGCEMSTSHCAPRSIAAKR